jgi:hypothetical protein
MHSKEFYACHVGLILMRWVCATLKCFCVYIEQQIAVPALELDHVFVVKGYYCALRKSEHVTKKS